MPVPRGLPPGVDSFGAGLADLRRRLASLERAASSGSGSGVTDHGALTGLGDDDHSQYLTEARGDARYPVRSVSAAVAAGTGTIDTTTAAAAEWLVRCDVGADSEVTRVVAVARSTTVSWTQYATVGTGAGTLCSYEVTVSTGTMSLRATPSGSATFDIVRTEP